MMSAFYLNCVSSYVTVLSIYVPCSGILESYLIKETKRVVLGAVISCASSSSVEQLAV